MTSSALSNQKPARKGTTPQTESEMLKVLAASIEEGKMEVARKLVAATCELLDGPDGGTPGATQMALRNLANALTLMLDAKGTK